MALQHLPPPSQRVISSLAIPSYFIQVPLALITNARNGGDIAVWPESTEADADGERSWKATIGGLTIYIRSQPVPLDRGSTYAVSPVNKEEIAIPPSLMGMNILHPEPTGPSIPAMETSFSVEHQGIPVLLSDRSTHEQAILRACKVCQQEVIHSPLCPTIREGYNCEWCLGQNGAHSLDCSGFASHH